MLSPNQNCCVKQNSKLLKQGLKRNYPYLVDEFVHEENCAENRDCRECGAIVTDDPLIYGHVQKCTRLKTCPICKNSLTTEKKHKSCCACNSHSNRVRDGWKLYEFESYQDKKKEVIVEITEGIYNDGIFRDTSGKKYRMIKSSDQ